ncbi:MULTISPECIES: hypothetical protein [unclassified Ruegeria]|uniref:hypothetical protein n=1 Tax=unclassified Ruegeria TaxID=2625375 RepID=UPI0014895011|nr:MULTISPECIES: hypothetical protein [unclassified Ruegeria]
MAGHENMLVYQRLRNRQIEALELASSWPSQREYQQNTPSVSVTNEVINQWDDVFDDTAFCFPKPIYTKSEEIALREYSRALTDVSRRTRNPLPELSAAIALSAWEDLRKAAQMALNVMMVRGRFSEDALIEDAD